MEGYVNNAGRFRIETGSVNSQNDMRNTDPLFSLSNNWSGSSSCKQPISNPLHLENPEQEIRWYFKYFLGKLHQIYMGLVSERDPVVIVAVITDLNNNNINQYRAIMWRKSGSQKLCIPYISNSPMTIKKILSCFDQIRFEKFPKEIFNYEVQKEILTLEEQEGSVNFKFGVIYCKLGQKSDEEMYNNEQGSEEFEQFLELLGDKIALKNWDRFRGGLDVKNDTTGTQSYYTIYEGHEVMFHVSTMLPITQDNRQQIERKRHIGNDIVNIIFLDGIQDEPFEQFWTPSMMKTHFTHIFALVSLNKARNVYRLCVFSEESVPLFGPPLPYPSEFTNKLEFREFLLVKLINGEKAAFNTPVFAEKRERTMEMLLHNVLHQYTCDNNNMLNRRAFSDIVLDHGNGISTTKEMTRNDSFIKYGQMLKVNIIIKGDAPTSGITTSLMKRIPWQPRIFANDLYYQISCGDTWGNKLILCTDRGTILIEENTAPTIIIEKACEIKQIELVESLGIMVFRCDKGRDSKVAVINLSELKQSELLPLSKADIKRFCIEKSRGSHLFELSKAHIQPVRLVVAVSRRLQIYVWRCTTCSSSLSSWNQFTSSDVNASFHFLRDLPTFELAQVVTLIDANPGMHICIGYRNQFDLINEKSGDTIHLYRSEMTAKPSLISILDLCSEEEPELLLCYNRTCHFQKIKKVPQHTIDTTSNSESDFTWNFEPKNIILALPYILAFTNNAIEIRLVVNGSLVHTMSVPNCKLITSKMDLFFCTTANNLCKELLEKQRSTPSSSSSSSTMDTSSANVSCVTSSFERSLKMSSPPPSLELCEDVRSQHPNVLHHQSSSSRNSLPVIRQHVYRILLSSLSGCLQHDPASQPHTAAHLIHPQFMTPPPPHNVPALPPSNTHHPSSSSFSSLLINSTHLVSPATDYQLQHLNNATSFSE